MTIGQVAKAAGMTASAIRYYESMGLIPAPRRQSGIRNYDVDIVDQLKVLRFYRASGISIQSLATLFAGSNKAEREYTHEAMVRRIAELETIIKDARGMKERLRKLLDCKCHGDRRKCVIFR
jgi:MerR family redox-sensitive transcriptional activator SoxR